MTSLLNKPCDVHALKCELAHEVLRSSGKLRLQVRGWSMLPSIRPGDTLLVEKAQGDAVREGDIVLFGRNRRLFAHRVIQSLDRSRIRTRGDAMPAADPFVNEQELLGRVSWIVRDGKAVAPRRRPGVTARAIATLARRSPMAARMVAGALTRHQIS